jgi:hypothetical protein
MNEKQQLASSSASDPSGAWYEVRVKGILDARWAEWFGGLAIDREGDDVTVISGHVIDQAALHGLLARVFDLGLVLVSVNRLPASEQRSTPARQRRTSARTIDPPGYS